MLKRRGCGPTAPLPAEHALAGFRSGPLFVGEAKHKARLLVEQMGYRLAGQEGARWRLKANGNAVGGYVDLLERPGLG